ncbi:hypothetical protein [Marinifilum caeruleilacunae]|uniref:Uncharacterized protein n=1 Tax=Marinifilum caeruleilacunae TaxID=2499076 RepID=A0ABX1X0U1_9BACT|nr:hypothetical protein [Marinifilum caeruleilacunae]NOU61990.1 hypothetical protein [Marinifilum caeruleilacunae]
MTTEEFVKAFYKEKEDILNEYLSENTETDVGQLIKSMKLSNQQYEIMRNILDSSFTDIYYGILLGLDGCSSIGGAQEMYELKDENGNQLSGEIEGFAYEVFHNQNKRDK